MVPEKYMTVADASRVLGISESTTRRYINKGLIPAIRIYGKFLIDALNLKKAIDEYMDFYNTRRLQAKLKGLAPLAYRNQTLVA